MEDAIKQLQLDTQPASSNLPENQPEELPAIRVLISRPKDGLLQILAQPIDLAALRRTSKVIRHLVDTFTFQGRLQIRFKQDDIKGVSPDEASAAASSWGTTLGRYHVRLSQQQERMLPQVSFCLL